MYCVSVLIACLDEVFVPKEDSDEGEPEDGEGTETGDTPKLDKKTS